MTEHLDHSRTSNQKSASREELLRFELEQAREDSRSSLNHISQIIVAGIAGLAILFTITNSPYYGSDNVLNDALIPFHDSTLFVSIAIGIVFATFFYVSSVGMERVFRYHYMRGLEKELETYSSSSDAPIFWNEASAPLITTNPKHFKTRASKIHFFHMIFGILFALLVCAILTMMFLVQADIPTRVAAGVIAIPLAVFLVAEYVKATSKSKAMYNEVMQQAEDRKKREKGATCMATADKETSPQSYGKKGSKHGTTMQTDIWGSMIRIFFYNIYPRPKDVLKIGFIVIGAMLGLLLSQEVGIVIDYQLERIVLAVFVIDVFAYQARYQINDIRGASEDRQNPQAEKRGRLPLFKGDFKLSAWLSFSTAILKIIAAIIASYIASLVFNQSLVFRVSLIFIILVFGLGAVYETVRSKGDEAWRKLVSADPGILTLDTPKNAGTLKAIRNSSFATLFLVSLGYPLRLIAGLSIVWPTWLDQLTSSIGPLHAPLIIFVALFALATMAFGESFVTLTWALEASDLKREMIKQPERAFYKIHIAYLGYALGKRISYTDPLKEKEDKPLYKVWNWSMLCSVLIMGLLCAAYAQIPWNFTGLAALVLFTIACEKPRFMDALSKISFAICGLLFLYAIAIPWFIEQDFHIHIAFFLCFTFVAYLAIYFSFRNTNYKKMNAPIMRGLVSFIIGKQTALKLEIIQEENSDH